MVPGARVQLLRKPPKFPFAKGQIWYVYVPKTAKGYNAMGVGVRGSNCNTLNGFQGPGSDVVTGVVLSYGGCGTVRWC